MTNRSFRCSPFEVLDVCGNVHGQYLVTSCNSYTMCLYIMVMYVQELPQANFISRFGIINNRDLKSQLKLLKFFIEGLGIPISMIYVSMNLIEPLFNKLLSRNVSFFFFR